MDPTRCLENVLDAIAAGNAEKAFNDASDLLAWLNRGGFPPDGMSAIEAWNAARALIVSAVGVRIGQATKLASR